MANFWGDANPLPERLARSSFGQGGRWSEMERVGWKRLLRRGRRAEAMTHTDALTGLPNRRRLERNMETGKGFGQTAVLMIDVDHFMTLTETYGHAMGDEVLRRVGAVLATTFRQYDVAYRYGGEAFCVLLPGTTTSEAMVAGERARMAIAAIDLPNGIKVTASVGVALAAGVTRPQTIEAADHALYQAKHNGRNRVEFSGPQAL